MPIQDDKVDLYYNDCSICRSSERFSSSESCSTFITKYYVIFEFDNQGERFQFNEYAIIEDNPKQARTHDSSPELIIKLSGMKEMIASNKEQIDHGFACFTSVPLYDSRGIDHIGIQFIKFLDYYESDPD